jgi:hypothetical protein
MGEFRATSPEAVRMDEDNLCHHLEQLALHLGIKIRYEPSAGKAGLCTLRGEQVLFVDERLPQKSRALALARLLCRFDTEDVFLPPVVRKLLQDCRDTALTTETQRAQGTTREEQETPGPAES